MSHPRQFTVTANYQQPAIRIIIKLSVLRTGECPVTRPNGQQKPGESEGVETCAGRSTNQRMVLVTSHFPKKLKFPILHIVLV